MAIANPSTTHILIFAVGRGNAAFIRTGLNQGFIVDMAGGEYCDPAKFIEDNLLDDLSPYPLNSNSKIAQVILSHPHTDHISQCEEVDQGKPLAPGLLTCPNEKISAEAIDWNRIKNPDGTEDLVNTYKGLYAGEKRGQGLQTVQASAGDAMPDLQYGIYYIRPPICDTLHPSESEDNEYGNATSLMLYLRHGSHSILLPGDMTPSGMDLILNEGEGTEKRFSVFDETVAQENPDWYQKTCDQPSLKSLLGDHGLSILVAPHHGLESCYSESLYAVINGEKPDLVVVSERRHVHENDGQTHASYKNDEASHGLEVDVEGSKETKHYVSTVNGHHILIELGGDEAPRVYLHKDLDVLLGKMNGL